MFFKSKTPKEIKQKLISDFKSKLIKQLGKSKNEFKTVDLAKQYAIDNNLEPIIIISSDNSEMVLLY